jgi:transglutaminase-like putative cysteine protease
MTIDQDLDHELAGFFAERATTTPPELFPRAVTRIGRVRQRPALLTGERHYPGQALGSRPFVLAGATLVLVIVVAGGAVVGSGHLGSGAPGATLNGAIWNEVAVVSTGQWAPPDTIAFHAQIAGAASGMPLRWRAGTYAEYTGFGWRWGQVARRQASPGDALEVEGPAADVPTTDGRTRVEITVTPEAFGAGTILGPGVIASVDKRVEVISVGPGEWFTSLEGAGGTPYTIEALIPTGAGGPGALTERRLRNAGATYPEGMLTIYTAVPAGAIGPNAASLLAEIRDAASSGTDPDNAYDLARLIETYLRDPARFTYDTDIRDSARASCGGLSTVECFATIKRGYCDYYATTMAVLLRVSGVPARVAYGFLPGLRDASGVEEVGASLAHMWVEVYFPGIGWVEFDPTGGGIGSTQPLPAGP